MKIEKNEDNINKKKKQKFEKNQKKEKEKVNFADTLVAPVRQFKAVSTRCTEQRATIFVYRSKNFFFDISIFVGRTSERKVSTVRTWCPEKYATVFVFLFKNFFFDI